MGKTAGANSGGTTFSVRSPVEVVASKSSTGTSPQSDEDLLPTLVSGERGKALRAQLASRYPDLSADEIEEAIRECRTGASWSADLCRSGAIGERSAA